jgi:hypothetical protein
MHYWLNSGMNPTSYISIDMSVRCGGIELSEFGIILIAFISISTIQTALHNSALEDDFLYL